MILCDLPYGTTACKWDCVLPFNELWAQYERIIKDNGAIVLFGSEPFSSRLRVSNLRIYRYDWVWKKQRGSGFQNANKMPLKNHENICVFYKKLPTYNPQFTQGKPYAIKGGVRTNGCPTLSDRLLNKNEKENLSNIKNRSSIASVVRAETINEGKRYPLTVLEFDKENNKYHPTQKPVALLEYLIKTYTNEGEIVLDNCMGSGSTGVACKNTSRNFIGIELNDEYFEIAKARIGI